MTDKLEETIVGGCCSDGQCRTCLKAEVERLRARDSEWKEIVGRYAESERDMIDTVERRDATIATLRGMMEKDSIRTREHNILVKENRRLRGENRILDESFQQAKNDWHHACNDMDKQDTTIATLRATLNENTEVMLDAAKKIATLRDRLEVTNAAIMHEIPKSGVHPSTQAFLLPFVELNEIALATKGEE